MKDEKNGFHRVFTVFFLGEPNVNFPVFFGGELM